MQPADRKTLNKQLGPIHAALARATLVGDEVEVVRGLTFRPTYVHVFAPAMAAFSPPLSEGGHHLAPWQVVYGAGEAATANVELVIPEGISPLLPNAYDALRLVAGLIRLLAASPCFISAASDRPLSGVEAKHSSMRIQALEPVPHWPKSSVTIDDKMIDMLRTLLAPASILFREDDVRRAFTLVDGVWWLPTWQSQMLAIWTAAEMLIRPDGAKGKGLADGIRSYLGRDGPDGDRRYNEVRRLYEARGGAAHAGRLPLAGDLEASFLIVRDVLIRSIFERERPPKLKDMTPVK